MLDANGTLKITDFGLSALPQQVHVSLLLNINVVCIHCVLLWTVTKLAVWEMSYCWLYCSVIVAILTNYACILDNDLFFFRKKEIMPFYICLYTLVANKLLKCWKGWCGANHWKMNDIVSIEPCYRVIVGGWKTLHYMWHSKLRCSWGIF